MAIKTLKNNAAAVSAFEAGQIQGAIARLPILKAAGLDVRGLDPFDVLLAEGAICNDSVVAGLVNTIVNSGGAPTEPWDAEMLPIAKEFGLPELIDMQAVTIGALQMLTEEQRAALRERVMRKVRK
jgi:hypothetical protein